MQKLKSIIFQILNKSYIYVFPEVFNILLTDEYFVKKLLSFKLCIAKYLSNQRKMYVIFCFNNKIIHFFEI